MSGFVNCPPNAAWVLWADHLDEDLLERQEAELEEGRRAALVEGIGQGFHGIEMEESEEEEEEDDDEIDDMEEYGDLHIPE
jgi:hypothetical protein